VSQAAPPLFSSASRPSLPVEIWRFRRLLYSLVLRDVKVKYQRSALGLVWTLLNPLLTVAILTAVFSYVIRIPIEHYWAFLISGYFVWSFVQQGLYRSTSVLQEHAPLSRSVAFPSEILILGACLSKLTEFLIEIVIVIAVLAVFHLRGVPPSLVLFPVLVLLQVLLVVGLMLPLSTVSVLFQDVQHALPILVTMIFYLSPVFYSVDLIPEAARPYYQVNPFVGLLDLFHTVLYAGAWPSAAEVGRVAGVAALVCGLGYVLFRRYRDVCVETA
jgi:ABC-type polysaccharide/polyol phosphate export permease